jgi:hypothetical protein
MWKKETFMHDWTRISTKLQEKEINCFPITVYYYYYYYYYYYTKEKLPGFLRYSRCSYLLLWPTRSDGHRIVFVQATNSFPFQNRKHRSLHVLFSLHKPVFQNKQLIVPYNYLNAKKIKCSYSVTQMLTRRHLNKRDVIPNSTYCSRP